MGNDNAVRNLRSCLRCSMRKAISLIEVIVALAIIAIVIALMLPAIQSIRSSAMRVASMNQMRQISVAVHNFLAAHDGDLPTIDGNMKSVYIKERNSWGVQVEPVVFIAIKPFLEHDLGVTVRPDGSRWDRGFVKTYLSPADLNQGKPFSFSSGICSYASNAHLFINNPNLTKSIKDGTSNTIMFTEHFSTCGPKTMPRGQSGDDNVVFSYKYEMTNRFVANYHRATFGDGGPILNGRNQGDVYPVTNASTSVTTASTPGLTFQARPLNEAACNWRIPQTPHREGMIVAYADGHVVTLNPTISEQVFWGSVTPSGGEVVALE